MRTGSGRCLIFAMQMASDYLARLTRAARRVQGPRSGTFGKSWTRELAETTSYASDARTAVRARSPFRRSTLGSASGPQLLLRFLPHDALPAPLSSSIVLFACVASAIGRNVALRSTQH